MVATVKRDGQEFRQTFRRGTPVTELETTKESARGTGTSIFFRPDPEIFESVEFDPAWIREQLEVKTYLNRNLRIVFVDETNDERVELQHEGGIEEYLEHLVEDLQVNQIHEDIFMLEDDELERGDVTPAKMWWFAWAIDKIDHGPPIWLSWICDEIGNLMPEHADNDYHQLYDRLSAYRDKYVDARRNKFSHFGIGHEQGDLHHMMRKKFRWQITLAGIDNPTGKTVAMGEAPMNDNFTQGMNLGQALSWNAQNYAEFSWSDVPSRFKVPGQLHIRFPEVLEAVRSC
jgi:hypothetical protein